uniref:Uncharacterized protein n=1 Tax=Solanum tuberosum TaxID=4113 RepID=M1DXC1_SOLTU
MIRRFRKELIVDFIKVLILQGSPGEGLARRSPSAPEGLGRHAYSAPKMSPRKLGLAQRARDAPGSSFSTRFSSFSLFKSS